MWWSGQKQAEATCAVLYLYQYTVHDNIALLCFPVSRSTHLFLFLVSIFFVFADDDLFLSCLMFSCVCVFFSIVCQCFLLNSTARFAGGHAEGFGSESKVIGDATESGMVRFAASRLLGNEDVDGFRSQYPKVNNTKNKWLRTYVRTYVRIYVLRLYTCGIRLVSSTVRTYLPTSFVYVRYSSSTVPGAYFCAIVVCFRQHLFVSGGHTGVLIVFEPRYGMSKHRKIAEHSVGRLLQLRDDIPRYSVTQGPCGY